MDLSFDDWTLEMTTIEQNCTSKGNMLFGLLRTTIESGCGLSSPWTCIRYQIVSRLLTEGRESAHYRRRQSHSVVDVRTRPSASPEQGAPGTSTRLLHLTGPRSLSLH